MTTPPAAHAMPRQTAKINFISFVSLLDTTAMRAIVKTWQDEHHYRRTMHRGEHDMTKATHNRLLAYSAKVKAAQQARRQAALEAKHSIII